MSKVACPPVQSLAHLLGRTGYVFSNMSCGQVKVMATYHGNVCCSNNIGRVTFMSNLSCCLLKIFNPYDTLDVKWYCDIVHLLWSWTINKELKNWSSTLTLSEFFQIPILHYWHVVAKCWLTDDPYRPTSGNWWCPNQGWHSCASARHRPLFFSLDAQVSI